MCLYLLLCIEPRNWPASNFARKKRTWKSHTCQCSQTEGAFTNYIGMNWYDRFSIPLFSNVGHYAVYCNGNWSPTLIQGGGTPTLFGIHFACIETMKHETYSSSPSMHWNWTTTDVSQSVGQFKTEAAVQGWVELIWILRTQEKIWLIKIENVNSIMSLCSIIEKRGLLHPFL